MKAVVVGVDMERDAGTAPAVEGGEYVRGVEVEVVEGKVKDIGEAEGIRPRWARNLATPPLAAWQRLRSLRKQRRRRS